MIDRWGRLTRAWGSNGHRQRSSAQSLIAKLHLAALHLGYETCAEHPLEIVTARPGGLQSHHFRLGKQAMQFADDARTVLVLNDYVRLSGIPPEAHDYVVNGRTPIEWFVDRYRVTQDRETGIVNDPNGWFAKPEDLIAAMRRIVHVSVETVRIVAGLPQPFADSVPDGGRQA